MKPARLILNIDCFKHNSIQFVGERTSYVQGTYFSSELITFVPKLIWVHSLFAEICQYDITYRVDPRVLKYD